ncbi:MAG: DUF4199 domain-containing protein [Chitinophagales bacterium]|nr:DUF4199 domain-containing protein [Chitinophagales bacterium]
MDSLRIEIRYAMLVTLLMLLWLAVEFMVGLHEEPLIAYHPIVTMFALIIPIVCARMAVNEKIELLGGKITFGQAFLTGFLVAFFAAVLSVPSELIFNKLINPDFFSNMIIYSVKMGKAKSYEEAAMYFNLTSYIIQTGLGTLVFGTLIALIMAWRMRTDK